MERRPIHSENLTSLPADLLSRRVELDRLVFSADDRQTSRQNVNYCPIVHLLLIVR